MNSNKIMDLRYSLAKKFQPDFTITKEDLIKLMISNSYKIPIYQSENFTVTYYKNKIIKLTQHLKSNGEAISNGDALYLERIYLASFVDTANL